MKKSFALSWPPVSPVTIRETARPRRAQFSLSDSLVMDFVPKVRRSAASADASYLSVDVYVFLIKSLRGYGWGNIGGARLAMTDRRGPGSGCGFSPGQHRRGERCCKN